jgi:hypothetical protein
LAKGAVRGWILPGLAALTLIGLTGCGPDSSASGASDASSAPSGSAAAAASASLAASNAATASAAAVAPAPALTPKTEVAVAPVCPKIVQPACPTPANLSGGAPKVLAAPLSPARRRLWAHPHRARYARHRALVPANEVHWARVDRSDTSRLYQDRVIMREDYAAVRPGCPRDCGGRRDFDMAGIDARGYLVWPGKVEY